VGWKKRIRSSHEFADPPQRSDIYQPPALGKDNVTNFEDSEGYLDTSAIERLLEKAERTVADSSHDNVVSWMDNVYNPAFALSFSPTSTEIQGEHLEFFDLDRFHFHGEKIRNLLPFHLSALYKGKNSSSL